MKTWILCLALLCAMSTVTQSRQSKDDSALIYWRALKCDTYEHLLSIIIAAQSGGPYAADEQFRHVNAGVRRPGRDLCEVMQLSSRLKSEEVGRYPAVEIRLRKLDDVIILKVIERGRKPWFAAIFREVGAGGTT